MACGSRGPGCRRSTNPVLAAGFRRRAGAASLPTTWQLRGGSARTWSPRDGDPVRGRVRRAGHTGAQRVGDAGPVQASPSPTQRQAAAAPSPTATPVPDEDLGCADLIATKPEPYPDPTFAPPPTPTIRGGDAEARDAITRAVDELAALGSYQFTVDIAGREITQLAPTTIDLGMQGTIDQTNGLALGCRVRHPPPRARRLGRGHLRRVQDRRRRRLRVGDRQRIGRPRAAGGCGDRRGHHPPDARGCRAAGRAAVRGRVPTSGSRDARWPGDHPLPPIGRG